jgi:hypothetical protein
MEARPGSGFAATATQTNLAKRETPDNPEQNQQSDQIEKCDYFHKY